MGSPDDWASASEIADYAYCPRSHWYHDHPPDGGLRRAARARAEVGERFHARELGGERRRAEHGGAYWAALALGIVIVLGAFVWILRP
jgi:hypothetical protein